MIKKILIGIIILTIGGAVVAYMMYNKPHKDIAAAKIDHSLNLAVLMDEFSNSPEEASSKYTSKVVAIDGLLKSIEKGTPTYILIEDDKGRIANCEMLGSLEANLNIGESVKVKGLFIGYEDLLEELQLKKCSILE
jgi:hypothetical protein